MSAKSIFVSPKFESYYITFPYLITAISNPVLLRPNFSSRFLQLRFSSDRHRLTALRASSNADKQPLPPPDFPDQSDHDLSLAQDSISQYLHEELGVSTDDARSIAFGSPKYAKMIIDSVRDLEEWNSWKGDREVVDGAGGGESRFKEKVICMVKEKGDDGRVAFLESVGMSLASAMGLARYLSSLSVRALIEKVKYMKELFYSGSDNHGLVGKSARKMMVYLSIPVDEDVQQTISLFEKMEARRGGLDMLGSVDASFRLLLESFPRLLLLSVESHMKPRVEFLISVGVPREFLGKVLLLYPPILLWNNKEIGQKVMALGKVGAVNSGVGKILRKHPWILSGSIQENYEQIINFFDDEKVPKVDVDRAIKRWPLLLGCSTSKLIPMVDQFRAFDIENKNLGRIIAKSPQLLIQKPQDFLKMVSFLEGLGFGKETMGSILIRCPEIFATSIEKTLKKKLEFLTKIGVYKEHFPRVIKKYPELLVSDTDRTLLPRLKYLMEIGLSERDLAFMVRKFSPLLGYGIDEVLKPKLEFLMRTMNKPVTDVVDYPRYFSYSLERKIKPRYWMLQGKSIECSLEEMLGKNDEDFATDFMGVERSFHL